MSFTPLNSSASSFIRTNENPIPMTPSVFTAMLRIPLRVLTTFWCAFSSTSGFTWGFSGFFRNAASFPHAAEIFPVFFWNASAGGGRFSSASSCSRIRSVVSSTASPACSNASLSCSASEAAAAAPSCTASAASCTVSRTVSYAWAACSIPACNGPVLTASSAAAAACFNPRTAASTFFSDCSSTSNPRETNNSRTVKNRPSLPRLRADARFRCQCPSGAAHKVSGLRQACSMFPAPTLTQALPLSAYTAAALIR